MAKRKLNKDKLEVDENILKLMQYGEQIKPIRNCNNYYVTTFGRVFSNKYMVQYTTLEGEEYYYVVWTELKQRLTNGYYCVNISNNQGVRKREYIHKLVFEAFNGSYNEYFFKIVFKDKNPENCSINNLKLEFKNKSKKTLEKYRRQQRLYEVLE